LETILVAKKDSRKPSGFGARLRVLREKAGLTQAALGEKVKMPYQAIAKYERGAVEPTWDTVKKLAKALKIKTDDFLTED
jgi:transcriptional regulator with XRE-family HTH domain